MDKKKKKSAIDFLKGVLADLIAGVILIIIDKYLI